MVKWRNAEPGESFDSSPIEARYYELTFSKVRSEEWETKPYVLGDRVVGETDKGEPVFLDSYEVAYFGLETDSGENVSLSLERPDVYMGDPNSRAILETVAPGVFDVSKTDEWPELFGSLLGKKFNAYVAANRWVRNYRSLVPAGKYKGSVMSFGYTQPDGTPYVGLKWSKNFSNVGRQFPVLYQISEGPYKGSVIVNPWGRYPVKRVESSDGEVYLTWGDPKYKSHGWWLDFCQVQLGIDLEELAMSGALDFVESLDEQYPNMLPTLMSARKLVQLRITVGDKGYIDNVMPDYGGTVVKGATLTPRQQMFAAINEIGRAVYDEDILSMDAELLYEPGMKDVAATLLVPLCDAFPIFNREHFYVGGDWDKQQVAGPMIKVLRDPRAIEALEGVEEEPDISWAFRIVEEWKAPSTGI